MFDQNAKIIEAMAPHVQRVLIADPHVANARMLGEVLRNMFRCQIWAADSTAKALKLAGSVDPDLIFVELAEDEVDGIAFTKKLRRATIGARKAPVIMMTGQATAASILAARDAGVHEFLRKPFTVKDLIRRLDAVILRPRDWIEAVDYVGPDRRRFNSGDYKGPLKRRSDRPATPEPSRIGQALKILKSAIAAVERDPDQAMRAMKVQLHDLRKAAAQAGDMKLTTAVIEFAKHIDGLDRTSAKLVAADLEREAAPLLVYLPKDDRAAA